MVDAVTLDDYTFLKFLVPFTSFVSRDTVGREEAGGGGGGWGGGWGEGPWGGEGREGGLKENRREEASRTVSIRMD